MNGYGDDYNNNTILNTTNIDFNNNICENVTNHWLYFIFTGYLLPIVSPIEHWFKVKLLILLKIVKGGKVVTLTANMVLIKYKHIENAFRNKNLLKKWLNLKTPGLLIHKKCMTN